MAHRISLGRTALPVDYDPSGVSLRREAEWERPLTDSRDAGGLKAVRPLPSLNQSGPPCGRLSRQGEVVSRATRANPMNIAVLMGVCHDCCMGDHWECDDRESENEEGDRCPCYEAKHGRP